MVWRLLPWIVWFIASVVITGLLHACVPASKKLTGPLACPAGTAEYVVWRHMTRTSNGKTSETSDLICIDSDGGGRNAGTLRPLAVGFTYTGGALALPLAVLLLRSRRGRRRAQATSTVGLLALVLLTGCPWGTVSSDELDKRYPYHEGRLFSRGVLPGIVAELEARVGKAPTVTGVNVTPRYVNFSVRDAKHPERVDTWSFDDGTWTTTPVQTERERDLDDESFQITGLPFGKLRDMIDTALGKLRIEDARVKYVSFNRFGDGVHIQISVEGPRQRGTAQFSAHGDLVKADID